IARLPIWAYVAALLGAGVVSMAVEPWHLAPTGSLRRYARTAVHLTAVSVVIYMTGWGPALVMAYAFVALEEVESGGAALWRPVMILSLANIAVAQFLIWEGLAPSFLSRTQAETV